MRRRTSAVNSSVLQNMSDTKKEIPTLFKAPVNGF